jgi:hypothetical protein
MNTLPPRETGCHRTGFAKSCRECVIEHNCQLWMQVQGVHPNTGAPVNEYGCADAFIPILLIENSQMQRQTGAAVESFRNEMVAANERALAAPRDMKLING